MIRNILYFLSRSSSKNALWLLIDKIIRLGFGLIVGVLVARYIGPVFYGKWNYAIAFVSLVSAFSTLGLDQIVIKQLLVKKVQENLILGTAFYLRLLGTFFCTILVCIFFYSKKDNELSLLAVFALMNLWFQTFDVIDLKNQSMLHSRKTVIAKNLAFILISFLKLYFIYVRYSYLSLVFLSTLECLVGACGLVAYYGINNVMKWRFNFEYCKVLLVQSWPLILSGIVVMMYMRVDQIMIGEFLGNKDVGYYSVSTRFTELWYFIPSILATSLFPNLLEKFNINKKEYFEACLKMLKILFAISLLVSLFFAFFSGVIVEFLYGNDYVNSVLPLQISIWTGIFVFWGVAAGNMLVIENLNKHNLIKSVQGLVLNIILNAFMIPKFGVSGAAISTLVSQFYGSYLYYLFHKETRHIFILQTKSILFI